MDAREPVSAQRAPILAEVLGIEDPATISVAFRELKIGKDDPDWPGVKGYSVAAGLGSSGSEAIEYAETHKLKFKSSSLYRKRLKADNLAIFYGKGDSMLPRIHDGDAIMFDLSDTRPRNKALYVIQVHGNANAEYQVKRALVIGGSVYFTADNEHGDHYWKEPRAKDDEKHPIDILGRVRWIGSWED